MMMNTEQMSKQPNPINNVPCRPFSNGSEFDHWSQRNCQQCKYGAVDDEQPHCVGEFGLVLALFNDGLVPPMALDFIGTKERTIDEDGAYCTLKFDCQMFDMPDDVASDDDPKCLPDVDLEEVVAEVKEIHGLKAAEVIRKRVIQKMSWW